MGIRKKCRMLLSTGENCRYIGIKGKGEEVRLAAPFFLVSSEKEYYLDKRPSISV